MPGRVAKKPIKFSFDETHVLMSQRKDKYLKKMNQKNRKALSRNNKVENQKDTEKQNVNKGVKDQKMWKSLLRRSKSARMILVALIFC